MSILAMQKVQERSLNAVVKTCIAAAIVKDSFPDNESGGCG